MPSVMHDLIALHTLQAEEVHLADLLTGMAFQGQTVIVCEN